MNAKQKVDSILTAPSMTWQGKKDCLADLISLVRDDACRVVMHLLRSGKVTSATPNGEVIRLASEYLDNLDIL